MIKSIKGTFQIKSTPEPRDSAAGGIGAMRMTFEKVFEGPLNGTSVVAMMGIMNKDIGSGAVWVA